MNDPSTGNNNKKKKRTKRTNMMTVMRYFSRKDRKQALKDRKAFQSRLMAITEAYSKEKCQHNYTGLASFRTP